MSSTILQETERAMTICNACRYCEGFCAVFPAMELRRTFNEQDLKYLANLCHNCRGCYYACQYAPPHEFDLNIPRTLAQLRQGTYEEMSWPSGIKTFFKSNGLFVSLIAMLTVSFFIAMTVLFRGSDIIFASHKGDGAFYNVLPYWAIVLPFSILAIAIVFSLWKSLRNFWQSIGGTPDEFKNGRAHITAIWDVLRLKYLDGGGHGCNYPDDRFSMIRRYFHHAIFYGFMLCLASTTIAFFKEHMLHQIAPYPFWSWPVLLGTTGGLAMIAGTGGMLYLKFVMDREPAFPKAFGMDIAFTGLLFFVSFSGLMLLLLRATPLMGILLIVHIGLVMGLFLTIPGGKFVHAIYRYGALVKNANEQQPDNEAK